MADRKRAKVLERVKPGKRARVTPEAVDHQHPLWSFREFDSDGRWCWSRICAPDALALIQRLKHYEGMTWRQIKQAPHCHFIEPSEIAKEAQMRLMALGKHETDALFSMSLGGKPRVWGILREHVMFTLWWDPEHEIYPSQRK